jgi:3D (Asp-Asp-Asp) domain-containing protein
MTTLFIAGLYLVTAYACPPHCGRTASGAWVGPGSIAAPRSVPFGTRLVVEGYAFNPGVVQDRGGAIWGNRLDVWLPSRSQAFAWGRRMVWVHQWAADEVRDEEDEDAPTTPSAGAWPD